MGVVLINTAGENFQSSSKRRLHLSAQRWTLKGVVEIRHADLLNCPAAVRTSLKTAHCTNPYKYIKGSSDVKSSV